MPNFIAAPLVLDSQLGASDSFPADRNAIGNLQRGAPAYQRRRAEACLAVVPLYASDIRLIRGDENRFSWNDSLRFPIPAYWSFPIARNRPRLTDPDSPTLTHLVVCSNHERTMPLRAGERIQTTVIASLIDSQ